MLKKSPIKIILLSFLSIFYIWAICSCQKKYADVEELYNDMIKRQNQYILALEKARTPDQVADAITRFALAMEVLINRAQKIDKKYPELKMIKQNPPPELEAIVRKFQKNSQRLSHISRRKISPFSNYGEIQKSLDLLKKATQVQVPAQ
jgi:recombinational DNA repair ATPase RecF